MKKGNEEKSSGKKKSKKAGAVFSFVLILAAAVAVFMVGWVQFYVPNGSRAVVVTKTSGVNPEVVKSGKFTWMWQRLLPTNCDIRIFSEDTFEFSSSVTETLPLSERFSEMIQEKTDFSYSFSISIKMKVEDEKLVEFVENENISTEKELNAKCESVASEISAVILSYFVAENQKASKSKESFFVSTMTTDDVIEKVGLAEKFPGFSFFEIRIENVNLPDLTLYESARNSYVKFMANMDENLKKASKEHADKIIRDQRKVSTLEQIGEVFKKYPELKDAFGNSSVTDLMKLADD